ncbi:uncharacterized protein LOC120369505 isoform X2 [Mauremys reevesii]|uniref:uncharacterized protein LOC120369505 isoform X2 n=1 Tax=Mauremys reevesii TaxID=260615 RepID=UPI00194003CD|nr:uncharacterized protein LOC120369505 isoform X2 [Mauremys reevesii]
MVRGSGWEEFVQPPDTGSHPGLTPQEPGPALFYPSGPALSIPPAPWASGNIVAQEHNYCSWPDSEGSVRRAPNSERVELASVRSRRQTRQGPGYKASQGPWASMPPGPTTASVFCSRQPLRGRRRAKAQAVQPLQIHGLSLGQYQQLFRSLVERELGPAETPGHGLEWGRRIKEQLFYAVGCPRYRQLVGPDGHVRVVEYAHRTGHRQAPPHYDIDTGDEEPPGTEEAPGPAEPSP